MIQCKECLDTGVVESDNPEGPTPHTPCDCLRSRLKLIPIGYDRLLDILRNKIKIDLSELPKDTFIRSVGLEYRTNTFVIILQSLDFDVPEKGFMPPEIPAMLEYIQ